MSAALSRADDTPQPQVRALRLIGTALTIAALLMMAIVVAMIPFANISLRDLVESYTAHNLVAATSVTIGLFLVRRQPRQAVAWVLITAGVLSAIVALATAIALAGIAVAALEGTDLARPVADVLDPMPLAAAWLKLWLWVPPPILMFIVILLIFPNGRLHGRLGRLVAVTTGIGATLLMAGFALGTPEALRTVPASAFADTNVFGFSGLASTMAGAGAAILLPSALGSALSMVLRYRQATGVQRLQVRWLAFGGLISAIAMLVTMVWSISAFRLVILGVVPVVPIAIGIAVTRYRLYDIDRIISRTVSYGVLSALLGLTFAGGVLGVQSLLGGFTEGDTLAVAASTLVVFALFQPLRRRIQRAVDRRFNRARIDAEATSGRFAERLRDEIDLETIRVELTHAATSALGPTWAGTWVRSTDGRRPGDG